jgi:hypothetical protein
MRSIKREKSDDKFEISGERKGTIYMVKEDQHT